jgi:hypothetical protein|tara:strand:+ start:1538 stop:2374 length:837 start_codon:yes stop_codon:yes gene_type:complete
MKTLKRLVITIILANFSNINAQDRMDAVGFAGDLNQAFVLGNQESVTVWLEWCKLHEEKNIEGIMLLAGDNIKLELPGGKSIIEGKENLKLSLESWFLETNDIQIQQSWGMPIKFINAEGELMSGDWIITGHTLKSSRNEVTSFEDNHINVLIDGGKVQYLKVFNHSLVEPVNVVVSVDLSNAKDKFESVSILGTFNDWCNSCDFMTDEDNDGVYTTEILVIPGEMEYKFSVDGKEEVFKPGTSCTKTTDIYTNRVLQIESTISSISAVCFNSCTICK